MNNICIKTQNLSKHFWVLKNRDTAFQLFKKLFKRSQLKKEIWALWDISFEIKKGEKIALIGKNGSGKTTLLRILSGIFDKTSGFLEVNDKPTALFKFCIGFNADLSVIDNIYILGAVYGIQRYILKPKINEILHLSEIYHLRFSSLRELSNGQQQRLALSIFFQSTGNLLIFDESLAFVDRKFSNKCEEYFKVLSLSDKTVIMTSHDTEYLKKYCTRAIWLDKGKIRMDGDCSRIINSYELDCLENL